MIRSRAEGGWFSRTTSVTAVAVVMAACGGGEPTAPPVPDNVAPQVQATTATPSSILDTETSVIAVTASDADGDALTYVWSATGGTISGSGASVTFTPPQVTAEQTVTVNVTVSDGNGGSATGSVGVTVRHADEVTVLAVTPNSGFSAGGTTVTITGSGFEAVPTVTFGGAAATGVAFQSATTLLATTPAHAAGAVEVVVMNPSGQSGTLANGYTYLAPPTVASVTPAAGTVDGGTAITIAGTGFVDGATITLGGTAATNVTVASATSITATSPAHAAGAVDVVVTNPDSQSGTLAGGFTYVAGPTVTSVTPTSGFAVGGDLVTITGTGFVFSPTVTFGGTAATAVAFQSATTIIATTPAHAAGSVDVVVTNPDNQTATLSNGFTFVAAPEVTTATHTPNLAQVPLPDPVDPDFPSRVSTWGNNLVTITGSAFAAGATVTVGGSPATNVTVVSADSITFVTPAHAAGPVDVVVTNPDTQNGTLTGGLTYVLATTLDNDGGEYKVELAYTGGSYTVQVQLSSVAGSDLVTGLLSDPSNDNIYTETTGEILGDYFVALFRMSANSNLDRDRGQYICKGRIGGTPQTIGVADAPPGSPIGTFVSTTPTLLGAPATPNPLTGTCTLK